MKYYEFSKDEIDILSKLSREMIAVYFNVDLATVNRWKVAKKMPDKYSKRFKQFKNYIYCKLGGKK